MSAIGGQVLPKLDNICHRKTDASESSKVATVSLNSWLQSRKAAVTPSGPNSAAVFWTKEPQVGRPPPPTSAESTGRAENSVKTSTRSHCELLSSADRLTKLRNSAHISVSRGTHDAFMLLSQEVLSSDPAAARQEG